MSFNDVTFVFLTENYHRINFWYMSKDEAINLTGGSGGGGGGGSGGE